MESHNFLMWLFIIILCGFIVMVVAEADRLLVVVTTLCCVASSLCVVVASLGFLVSSLCLEGGKGGWGGESRSRFTENKTVLSQFTKNKIGISLTEKMKTFFFKQKLHTVTF